MKAPTNNETPNQPNPEMSGDVLDRVAKEVVGGASPTNISEEASANLLNPHNPEDFWIDPATVHAAAATKKIWTSIRSANLTSMNSSGLVPGRNSGVWWRSWSGSEICM